MQTQAIIIATKPNELYSRRFLGLTVPQRIVLNLNKHGVEHIRHITPDKMGEVIAGFLSIPDNLSETLKNLMEFLPWLFTTTAKEFVTGVATPLPISI